MYSTYELFNNVTVRNVTKYLGLHNIYVISSSRDNGVLIEKQNIFELLAPLTVEGKPKTIIMYKWICRLWWNVNFMLEVVAGNLNSSRNACTLPIFIIIG